MTIKLHVLLPGLLASCAMQDASARPDETNGAAPNIIYASSDLGRVAVFTEDSARFGSRLALSAAAWPSSPARYFEADGNVKCVAVGPEFNTIEFAVKRPIQYGDQYHCLKTTFRVAKCFDRCHTAIIEREYPVGRASTGASLTSYFYVDSCRGIIAFAQESDLREKIPRDAESLRGRVGILADQSHPDCSRS